MRERVGPSPLVPFLTVGTLGLLICWPLLLSLWEIVIPILQLGSGLAMVLLILVLLIHLLSSYFPTLGSSCFGYGYASASDGGDGFGFGMILLLLFLVLYNLV
ncbi:hypothetical protein L484_023808 [Morus notabilis]|uniref:Uncharacterized protein n=1 Tax=Morus notabilis TaxID=981085 RepID=W9R577_9ROSA|nr:hypothetical protein L484_023808 [Morus notabilis]